MKKDFTIEDVILNPRNAKQHPQWHIKELAASIKDKGCWSPLMIDQWGMLLAGHGRFLAMRDVLGYTKLVKAPYTTADQRAIPYFIAEHFKTKLEGEAAGMADNKIQSKTKMERALEVETLNDIHLAGYDITLLGYDLDMLLSEDDKDDRTPDAPKKPRSKLGDIYILGKHTLICGDSTDPKTYQQIMNGTQADMVFTDPPYNVNYSGRGKTTSRKIENDDMTPEQFDQFLNGVFQSLTQFAKDGAGWYVFHSTSTQAQFEYAMKEAGLTIKNQLIWNKPTASMGWGDYRWKHEPFYYAGKEKGKLSFYGDRTNSTVINFHDDIEKLISWVKREKRAEAEGATTVWTMKRDSFNEYVHPTQKPVELILHALVNSSKQGDVVLDPFGGSGSTLIACEKANRACRTIELDPTFVDIIVQRYVDRTGDTDIKKNGKADKWEPSEKVATKKQPKKKSEKEKPEHLD